MTNTITPRIDSVRIEWEPDDDYPDADVEDPMRCHAIATVSYPCGDAARRLERLISGGLCGIDLTGPDDPYRREVEQEQLSDLREHLTVFGITCTDAEWAALVTATHTA